LLKKLQGFNAWITHNLPAISNKIVTWFMPIWQDVKQVMESTGTAMRSVADSFSDIVGLLTGDTAIAKSTDTFEKFGMATQKVAHIFAIFAETLNDVVDLLAHLIDAVVHLSTGQFSKAGQDLRAGLSDINARTIGAALMVGTAFVAPELVPEEAETLGAEVAAPGILARLLGRGVGLIGRHPVLAGGIGANIGDMLTSSGTASPALISALQQQESGSLGMAARSPKGAIGTMQLMPGTAAQLGVNPYDPAQNVAGGTTYLNQLLKRYGGDVPEALGAYNAGPGRMDAFLAGKATLPAETQQYIASVLARSGKTGDVNIGGITIHITQPGASAEQIASTTVNRIQEAKAKQVQRNQTEFSQLSWSY
jgi:hypothetical protein